MKKILLLFLLLPLVLLTSCEKSSAPLRTVKSLRLGVQQDLSINTLAGLDTFIQKVHELSGGSLLIETTTETDVLDALENGASLILSTNAELSRANANFSTYTSPFYFSSYTHMSLTLNSSRFLEIIDDGTLSLLHALPIAAFYDGSSVILSSTEMVFDTVDQFDGREITVANDPAFVELLRGLGARVRIREEESQRIEGFCQGTDQVIECRTSSLAALAALEKNRTFTICQSFHRSRVNWLMLSEKTNLSLTEQERAILTEAAAYAIATNDTQLLEAEQNALLHAKSLGGDLVSVLSEEFGESAAQILRASTRYGGLWDWEQYLEVQKLTLNKG